MISTKLNTSTMIRLAFLTVIIFLLSSFAVSNVAAEPSGYISPNPNDLPPDMNRDTGPASTDPNRPPAYGPEDAKVLVIIFADYQCPACKRASQSTHQIAAECPGEVRIEFWNNPIESHRNADLAAIAGLAAQRQGKFWEMHDLLFENGKHDQATLELRAAEIDLDIDQFRTDMNDPALRERVMEEHELAFALGATNTPSYLVNGRLYKGWGSWQSLRGKVERELVKTNEMAAEGMPPFEIKKQRALDNNSNSETYELYRVAFLEPEAI
jgi:protein-disulfide isomerase